MTFSSFLSKESLPLREKGFLKYPKDWILLWEKFAVKGPAVLLESAGPLQDAGRWIILAGNPEAEFYEKEGSAWVKNDQGSGTASVGIFEFLDQVGMSGFDHSGENYFSKKRIFNGGDQGFLPFPHCLSNAWFGLLSYEFGRSFSVKKQKHSFSPGCWVPDYYFFKPRWVLAFDRSNKEYFSWGGNMEEFDTLGDLKQNSFRIHALKAQLNLETYQKKVEKVKDYISNGDIYQANISQAFQARWEGGAANLYRLLKEMNPGPFMGLFQGAGFTVVSSSPERLASGQGDWLETRPIAGTRPRGQDEIQDLQLQWELKTNIKEQAEHLMLVDLARNDMGKISDYGSVEVKKFAFVESYAKVHHLVSVIQSRRQRTTGFSEIIKSIFPGGTITGCPKVRCMEIIEEIESHSRGYYTGSMGYLTAGTSFDFNILIRSFTLFSNGFLEFCAGAGIVADSDPEKEYMETLYKVEALAQALGISFLSKS